MGERTVDSLRGILVTSVLGLLLAGSASATTLNGTSVCNGTARTSFISFDGTNYASETDETCINNSGGSLLGTVVNQVNFPVTPIPCTFSGPQGTSETGIQSTEVGFFGIGQTATGSFLFNEDTSATFCTNPVTHDFAGGGQGVYVGGSGVYSGATGTYTYTSVGSYPVSPAAPGFGSFGYVTSKVKSSLILAK